MHHDVFEKAKVITRQAFFINGAWIFMLTLVPFTTKWAGTAPKAVVPEFLYPMNMLLLSASFQWLDHRITKDNPGTKRHNTTSSGLRIVMYAVYVVCMVLAFIKPVISIYVLGISAISILIFLLK